MKKGVIAAAEFEPVKSEYDLSQSDIHSFKKQQNNRWQTELIKYQDELEELSSNKTQLIDNKSQFFITAPISGTLINTAQFGEGSFVSPGTLIAEISPNTDLIAECYVSPADIGLLKANQKVVFQIDAYNYNQWGFADGEILEISKDVELLENTPVFKVRCLINQDHLKLKNGVKGQIKKGMTLNARFLLTERSLFDLLYDNVDDWLNPSRV
ncbi:HlyD family secretion protein [Gillisia sp. Hel_I_86]|uniref:HlyD family secretion protein n=1 Tax=Gillisia sp. Hel_I_86 TaxID=1249981 RepID=UPI0021BD488D|nr:HlyD family secretion protein [Gillisia sp. Hel_I_86]